MSHARFRVLRRSLLSLGLLVGAAAGLAVAEEAPQEPAEKAATSTWRGYVRKAAAPSGDASTYELGSAFVAKGVMAGAVRRLEPAFASRLGPLLSTTDDTVAFLNYRLEARDPSKDPALPRWILTLEGREEIDPEARPAGHVASDAVRTLRDARLVKAEYLPEAWLRAWRPLFLTRGSPWRLRMDEPKADPKKDLPGVARKIQQALLAMRAVPSVSAEAQKALRGVAPKATLHATYRLETERAILRWLRSVNDKHALGLEGLDKLGPLPPNSTSLTAWFMQAKDKAAFQARLAKAWQGSVEGLHLVHYRKQGTSTSWTRTPLAEVEGWDARTFARRQATTREILAK